MVYNLVTDISLHIPVIVRGDFNGWAIVLGSQGTNEELVLVIKDNSHTFRRAGNGSIVDLAFVSVNISRDIEWKVSEHYTYSDHKTLIIAFNNRSLTKRKSRGEIKAQGWSKDKIDTEFFIESFSSYTSTEGTSTKMSKQLVSF